MKTDAEALRASLARDVAAALREIPDFPRPGVLFRDITPLLADPALFRRATDGMAEPFVQANVTHVVAIESRGFILGAPVAQRLGAGFVPIRKPGKLPHRTAWTEYALEYRAGKLEIHADACASEAVVLIVDDVLATGGTAQAAGRLIAQLGAEVAGYSLLLEIAELDGRALLHGSRVEALASV